MIKMCLIGPLPVGWVRVFLRHADCNLCAQQANLPVENVHNSINYH